MAIIRYTIKADFPQIVRIYNLCYGAHATAAEDIHPSIARPNVITISVVDTSLLEVLGFAIFELSLRRIRLLRIAVKPSRQREGYGRQLVERLFRKLNPAWRNVLQAVVREDNLDGQLFLKALGFTGASILGGRAYTFEYHCPMPGVVEEKIANRWQGIKR